MVSKDSKHSIPPLVLQDFEEPEPANSTRKPRKGEIRLLQSLLERADSWSSNFILRKRHEVSSEVIKRHVPELKAKGYLKTNPKKNSSRAKEEFKLTQDGTAYAIDRIEQSSTQYRRKQVRWPATKVRPLENPLTQTTLTIAERLSKAEIKFIIRELEIKLEDKEIELQRAVETLLKSPLITKKDIIKKYSTNLYSKNRLDLTIDIARGILNTMQHG